MSCRMPAPSRGAGTPGRDATPASPTSAAIRHWSSRPRGARPPRWKCLARRGAALETTWTRSVAANGRRAGGPDGDREKLLAAGAKVDMAGADGETLLLLRGQRRRSDGQAPARQGRSGRRADEHGETSLRRAAWSGAVQVAICCWQRNAIRVADKDGIQS